MHVILYFHLLQKCDQFSADLFSTSSAPTELPILCNSTTSANSTESGQARNNFCSKVWITCQNVSMVNSPFAASLKGKAPTPVKSNSTKLTDLWQSEDDFCNAFGGASSDGSVCFAGEPVALNSTEPLSPAGGLCLEKIGNGSYLDMAAHPDGSNRAFFSSQEGKIWLATIPEVDSGKVLELDETNPFLDLTDEVHFDTQFGMMGIAFHPKFSQNGRFFASFNCEKQSWAGCAGRCSCNSDVDCDPSTLPSDSGSRPCQYQSVIAEFTVNGTANQPSEVIFSLKGVIFSHYYLTLNIVIYLIFSRQNLPARKKSEEYSPWAFLLLLIMEGRFFLDLPMDICIS